MKKQNITIDTLARMIAKGFEETAKKKDVDRRFDKVEDRLEKIEKLLIVDHHRRIEKLEVAVKELRDLLAIK